MTTLATAPDTHFLPDQDSKAFQSAVASFATGVTVVTTDRGEGPVGIVTNNFLAVSNTPPLVLWSPAKASHRFEHFRDARRFAVHVLTDAQKHVMDAINGSKTAFDGFDWSKSQAGIPLIHHVAACFECNLESTHDAGDHILVIGRVIRGHHQGGTPLILHGGRSGTFAEPVHGS